jgi:hypothetical protein
MNIQNIEKLSSALMLADSQIGDFRKAREAAGEIVDTSSQHGWKNGKALKLPPSVRAAYTLRDSFRVIDAQLGGALTVAIAEFRKADGAARRAGKSGTVAASA